MEVRATEIVGELRELIAALDRRVPHLERAGEGAIAYEAAALKVEALRRIAELERQDADRALAEAARESGTARSC